MRISKKVDLGWKSYFAPTPKNIRILGDTLLGIASILSGYAILSEDKSLALIFLIIAVVGKFLSNFFKSR